MSAELLHRAAKTLREHAEAATPGPWLHVDYHDGPYPDVTFMGCGSITTMADGIEGGDIAAPNGDLYPRSGYSPKDDMAHIALMHPPVALALADHLDAIAPLFAGLADGVDDGHEAVRLARAILREDPA